VFFFIFESMIFISNSFWNVQVIQSCRILESKSISTLFSMTYNFVLFDIQNNVPRMARFIRCISVLSNVLATAEASTRYFELSFVLTLLLWICRSRSIPPDRKFANNVEICWTRIWSFYQIKVDFSIKTSFFVEILGSNMERSTRSHLLVWTELSSATGIW